MPHNHATGLDLYQTFMDKIGVIETEETWGLNLYLVYLGMTRSICQKSQWKQGMRALLHLYPHVRFDLHR